MLLGAAIITMFWRITGDDTTGNAPIHSETDANSQPARVETPLVGTDQRVDAARGKTESGSYAREQLPQAQDLGLHHIDTEMERMSTPAGRASLQVRVNVRKLEHDPVLNPRRLVLTARETMELEASIKPYDDELTEALLMEHTERCLAIRSQVLTGKFQSVPNDAPVDVDAIMRANAHAAVSVVPGPSLSSKRILVCAPADAPDWFRVRSVVYKTMERRDAAISNFYSNIKR
jgi:hypothetical protein